MIAPGPHAPQDARFAPRDRRVRRTARPGRSAARLAVLLLLLIAPACGGGSEGSSSEPWGSNTVTPAELARELTGDDKPVVICTNLPSMYAMGHIPGAVSHGPGTSPAALRDLKAWAETLPRESRLVIYCGCCPLAYCPNLRPPYQVLEGMGFRQVRVLLLPENFGTDWVARGYPVTR